MKPFSDRSGIVSSMRRLARRAADFLPFTWRGTFIALFSGVALWRFGYGTLDLLLFVTGISGLVLVALGASATVASTLYLRRRVSGAAYRGGGLEAGSPIRTGFSVPALGAVPLIKIGWQWLEPAEVECRVVRRGGRLHEEVVARKRGQVTGIRRRFTVGDAFGLAAVSWERADPGPLTILPYVGRLKNMPVIQPMAAAEGLPHPMGAPEGDRMEIRRYVPGDSVRDIMWKTFARTRQLNVRTPEKSIDRSRKTVAYLLTDHGDEAAAAAARVALESELLGAGWLFGADGTPEPAESLEAALDAIARSGSLRHHGNGNGHDSHAGGLSSFLARQATRGETHCIIFAPASPGAWTARALAASRNFSGAMSFVLGTDGVVPRGKTPLWRRLLFIEAPLEGVTTDELSDIMRQLTASGSSAMVVDRASGRSFSQHGERGLMLRGAAA